MIVKIFAIQRWRSFQEDKKNGHRWRWWQWFYLYPTPAATAVVVVVCLQDHKRPASRGEPTRKTDVSCFAADWISNECRPSIHRGGSKTRWVFFSSFIFHFCFIFKFCQTANPIYARKLILMASGLCIHVSKWSRAFIWSELRCLRGCFKHGRVKWGAHERPYHL